MIPRDFNDKDSINVSVRNTFLDFSEDDPWTVSANPNLRRQQTDSILQCNANLRGDLSRSSWQVDESQLPEFPSVPMPMIVDPGAFASPGGDEDEDDAEDDEDEDDQDSFEAAKEETPQVSVSPEIQAMREIAANGGGVSGCTTVMMRHVPFKYTQRKLLREINSLGFMGQYDFMYLPMDPRSHANRGFAFLNMVSADAAEKFYAKFHGQYLRHFTAEKALVVLPADVQGFEENALQYAATGAHRGRRTGHTKPIFFRPLPPHIAAKLEENKPSPLSVQPKPATVARRLPERPVHYTDRDTQEMAAAMLQQALLPAMMRANWPLTSPMQEKQDPAPAQRTPCFCVYCGKKRVADHIFCPYCGNHFPK